MNVGVNPSAAGILGGHNPGISWAGVVSWRDSNPFKIHLNPFLSPPAVCQPCPARSWGAHLFWEGDFGIFGSLEFSLPTFT